jgi:hypothetical protein
VAVFISGKCSHLGLFVYYYGLRHVKNYHLYFNLVKCTFLCSSSAQVNAEYNPGGEACIMLNTEQFSGQVTTMLAVDTFLLLLTLAGLSRWKDARAYRASVWQFLWGQVCMHPDFSPLKALMYSQGIMWIALALLVEIPAVVFVWLDLNRALSHYLHH